MDKITPSRSDSGGSEVPTKELISGASLASAGAISSPSTVEPPPERLGDYKILKELGAGTFGRVFQAQRDGETSCVAIKQLKAEWARIQSVREQFLAEARRMMQFDHPGIVRVNDLAEQADPPFFVQQLIEGLDLRQRIEEYPFDPAEATQIVFEIADALTHIHSFSLYHRDLKPENILIDQQGRAHVTDFGLALADAERWDQPKRPAGTPAYMPPEQLSGDWELLNPSCDLWSLGVIYYELLTGKRPFERADRDQLRREISCRVPPAPGSLDPSIPRAINHLCMQCLEKDVRLRPSSAADLRDDMEVELDRLRQKEFTTIAPPPSDRVVYPTPTLRRFTAPQAKMYLRLMPRSYANQEELPELIHYWKERILRADADDSFRIGVLVGVSGCGKSSLLEAGLLPELPQHVTSVLVQATEAETEVQLLKALQKAFPVIESGAGQPESETWSLAEWTRALREGRLLPNGHKILIVLDQFEQWLHAHGDDPVTQLRDALQHCDGQHLQAMICVREGFHSSLTRFVRSLGVSLDEERNYATAHRFDIGHARFVLEQFGHGTGQLEGELTEEQQQFLQRAVEELAKTDQDGVRSVRLVVFAMVMAQRSWTVEELEKLGGLEGIGRQFLIDSFQGRTAPEQYQHLRPAAIKVLERLLPEEGLEIKDSRTAAQLLEGSELPHDEFDTLLEILVRKLFLVTPVDPDKGSVDENTEQPRSDSSDHDTQRFYQLTHDFLVPSIRQWIEFMEEQSLAGRARLLLRRLTGAWQADHESKRHLPSLPEYWQIRRRTEKKKWTASQQRLMTAAGRHHLTRSTLIALAAMVLGVMAYGGYYESRANGLRNSLLIASVDRIDEIRQQLPDFAWRVDAKLLPIADECKDPKRRLHAQIGLVERHVEQAEPLRQALLDDRWDFEYLAVIGDTLQAAEIDFTNDLWDTMRDETESDPVRWRAGLVLSKYMAHDPASESSPWQSADAEFLVEQYLATNPEFHGTIRDYLFPNRELLRERLADMFFRESLTDVQQVAVARAVREFYPTEYDYLLPMLLTGAADQYLELYPLVANTDVLDVALLSKIRQAPADDLGVEARIQLGKERAGAAITWLRKGGSRREALEVLKVKDDPEAMTQFIHRCRTRGLTVAELLELWALLPQLDERCDMPAAVRKSWDSQLFGVLLALGEYSWSQLPKDQQENLLSDVTDLFRDDKSSGVHAAAGWLLRTWGQQEEQIAKLASKLDEQEAPRRDGWEWYTEALEVTGGLSGFFGRVEQYYQTYVLFDAGEYRFGSPQDDPDRVAFEVQHRRDVAAFAVLDREITRGEFEASDLVYFSGYEEISLDGSRVMTGPSWYDAVRFCGWLNDTLDAGESQAYAKLSTLDRDEFERDRRDRARFQGARNWPVDVSVAGIRLPTEHEWEALARSDMSSVYSFGSDPSLLPYYARFADNSERAHPPRQLRPTLRGLFDVHGNVAEWCHDWFGVYEKEVVPTGPPEGTFRVMRGGSWHRPARACRSAVRLRDMPSARNTNGGFRVLRSSVKSGQDNTEPGSGGP